jgi:hypothetical protein
MARLIHEPLTVYTLNGVPAKFIWRRHCYVVKEVVDSWRDTGEWWKEEEEKDFYWVKTVNGGVFCLGCELKTKEWFLYKVDD